MATPDVVLWDAIIRDPRFQNLRRRNSRSLCGPKALGIDPAGCADFISGGT